MLPGTGSIDAHFKPYRFMLLASQWHRCMGDVRIVERTVLGRRYRHVAFTRLDLVWLAVHPPLAVLEAARCEEGLATVWAMDGEEYGGLNDRYLLVERDG